MSTLSPGMGPGKSDLGDQQGVQSGNEMELRIRQGGESDDKQKEAGERPEFHIHTYTDASFSMSGGRSRSGFLVCLGTRNGRIFGFSMVFKETNYYSLFSTRGRDCGHV